MRVLNESVEKKEVKKTRPRLKQADQVRDIYNLLINPETNHLCHRKIGAETAVFILRIVSLYLKVPCHQLLVTRR